MVKKTIGFSWGPAGTACSYWTGVRMSYLLRQCGIDESKYVSILQHLSCAPILTNSASLSQIIRLLLALFVWQCSMWHRSAVRFCQEVWYISWLLALISWQCDVMSHLQCTTMYKQHPPPDISICFLDSIYHASASFSASINCHLVSWHTLELNFSQRKLGAVFLWAPISQRWVHVRNGGLLVQEQHVCFKGPKGELPKGDTTYGTSVPMWKAMGDGSDIIVCWKQNGRLLDPDHGFPVSIPFELLMLQPIHMSLQLPSANQVAVLTSCHSSA